MADDRDMLSCDGIYLFVPADRKERVGKALGSGADRVIVDLEDAVAPARKQAARAVLATSLPRDGQLVVRINAFGTDQFDGDIAACCRHEIVAIMLPKADLGALDALRSRTDKPVIALIETACGLRDVREVAASAAVVRLAFGSIDLAADLGLSAPDTALDGFRLDLVLASRLAGKAAPIDGVLADFRDMERLGADTRRVLQLGMTAKLCIHPSQIETVRQNLAPTDAEIAWAKSVLASGDGAVSLGGVMVDKPVRDRAARILEQYRPKMAQPADKIARRNKA